jgi:gamma-glutamyltranspeptidase/glutathione hydrolase
LIQSLFWGFGSGICEPATGIVAQNRGACFTLEPGHPNTFAPGKLPAHTLMPVLVHDERGVAAVAGSMGGYAQPQINAQTLLHLLGGAAPADAVAAPRRILERPEPASRRGSSSKRASRRRRSGPSDRCRTRLRWSPIAPTSSGMPT